MFHHEKLKNLWQTIVKVYLKTHRTEIFISRSNLLDSRNPTETLNIKTQNIEFVNENIKMVGVFHERESEGEKSETYEFSKKEAMCIWCNIELRIQNNNIAQ